MKLPLPLSPEPRDKTLAKDSRLVNCYAEASEEGAKIIKRDGLILSNAELSAPGTPGQGIFYLDGVIYTVNNDQLCYYTPPSGGGSTGWVQL